MRINITNCRTEKPTNGKEFQLSFDSDIIPYAVNNEEFAKSLAKSLREFADLLEARPVIDEELF